MVLSKMILPAEIEVGGKFFAVKTGHPYWFRFSEIIREKEVRADAFDYLFESEIPEDRKSAFDALVKFFAPEKELPRIESRSEGGEIALDYVLDADLIYAAFLEQYGVDLFEREIHWHKILAMIEGLHSTKLNDVIGYRLYTKPAKNDSYERSMERLKRIWRIETEEDRKAKEAEKAFFAKLRKPKINTGK